MVRLEEEGAAYHGGDWMFQFHDGAIRSEAGVTGLADQHCFNSTMVRLEALNAVSVGFDTMFQFHDGAIRSRLRAMMDYGFDLFQFHDGAIRSQSQGLTAEKVACVSIPRWCD